MAYAKPKNEKQQPPPSTYVPKCPCGDRNCRVEQTAPKVARFFKDSHNGAISVMAQIKEASIAVEIPGVRAAAGGVLIILETIGLMGDNAAAFDQIAAQSLDNYLLLVSCMEFIDTSSPDANEALKKLDEVGEEFKKIMNHITASMESLNSRGKIRRFIYAKADKNDIDKHKSAMAHLISKLQIVLQFANLTRAAPGASPVVVKKLTEKQVHETAEGFKAILIQRAEDEYNKQVAEYNNSPQLNLNATANFNAGAGSLVKNSGNVTTHVVSGQNDYSNHTSTVNITNGDFRSDSGSSSRRRERGSRRSSPSDDSDEEFTPRARQEQRDRRAYERNQYR